MSEPYVYTDPDGDVLEVHSAASGVCLLAKDMADGESVCVTVTYAALEGIAKALLEKAGFPAAEMVTPVPSSVNMRPDEDWETLLRRCGRQHASVYPDPARAAGGER